MTYFVQENIEILITLSDYLRLLSVLVALLNHLFGAILFQFFKCIYQHKSGKYDVQPPKPQQLTFVSIHGLLLTETFIPKYTTSYTKYE